MIDCRPADLLVPEWDSIVEEAGDAAKTDEDRLTYAMFPKVALTFFQTRGKPLPETPAPASKPEATSAPTPAAAPAASPSAPVAGGSAVYTVTVNGKPYTVQVGTGAGTPAPAAAPAPQPVAAAAPVAAPSSNGSNKTVTSPLPGSVFAVKCKVGDQVNEGDTVMILESMKMETEVHSPHNGTIQTILVQEGANVQTGDELIHIS